MDFWEDFDILWAEWERIAAGEVSSTVGLEPDERPGHDLNPEEVTPVYPATRAPQEVELVMAAKWLRARATEAKAGRAYAAGQHPSAYAWRRSLRSAWKRHFARCHSHYPAAAVFLSEISHTAQPQADYTAAMARWEEFWKSHMEGPIAAQRRQTAQAKREVFYEAMEQAKAEAYLRLRPRPPPTVETVQAVDAEHGPYHTSSLTAVVEAHRREWAKWWDEAGESPNRQEDVAWHTWLIPLPVQLTVAQLRKSLQDLQGLDLLRRRVAPPPCGRSI
jgi:hypothetical protein